MDRGDVDCLVESFSSPNGESEIGPKPALAKNISRYTSGQSGHLARRKTRCMSETEH
jgi:hypothetical protein